MMNDHSRVEGPSHHMTQIRCAPQIAKNIDFRDGDRYKAVEFILDTEITKMNFGKFNFDEKDVMFGFLIAFITFIFLVVETVLI